MPRCSRRRWGDVRGAARYPSPSASRAERGKHMTALTDTEAAPDACASKLFVCITCRLLGETSEETQARPGARLMEILSQRLEDGEQDIEIVPVECLSNCTPGCTVAVSGPGKWTYVIGALDPDQHAGDVLQLARLHHAHADGRPDCRQLPVPIRNNTDTQDPPLPHATH